jgi:hypothetical protein
MEINNQGRIIISAEKKWTAEEVALETKVADMYCRQADFCIRVQDHEQAETKLLMDKIYQVRMTLLADGDIRKESSLGTAAEGFLSSEQRATVVKKLMNLISDL